MVATYYNLSNVFPKRNRLKNSTAFSYLVFHRKIERLNNLLPKASEQKINYQATKYQLTAAMVAAIIGDFDTLENLHRKGADLTLKDHKGWTVAHHAVMGYRKNIVAWLKQMFPSTEHIESLIYRYIRPSQTPFPESMIYRDEEESLKTLDKKKFKELTGKVYTSEIKATPKQLIEIWKTMKATAAPSKNPSYENAYEKYLKNPSPLFITKVTHNDRGDVVSEIGLGVFAREDIPIGTCVTEYVGELVDKPKLVKDDHYLFGNINGRNFCNEGPLINHSFPNCTTTNVRGRDNLGPEERMVFIAMENIQAGSQILYDYGQQERLLKGFISLQPNTLLGYFKPFDFVEFINKPIEIALRQGIKGEAIIEKFVYLLCSPKEFILLLCEGDLDFTPELHRNLYAFIKKYDLPSRLPPLTFVSVISAIHWGLKNLPDTASKEQDHLVQKCHTVLKEMKKLTTLDFDTFLREGDKLKQAFVDYLISIISDETLHTKEVLSDFDLFSMALAVKFTEISQKFETIQEKYADRIVYYKT